MADSSYVLGDEDRRKFAKIVAQAWSDTDFAQRYADSPREILNEFGLDYPAEVQTPALPPKPQGDLSLEALESVAAGAESGCAGSVSSVSSLACPCGTAFTASCAGTWGVQPELPGA